MAESSEGPEEQARSSTRMIAIAAVLAALLALVVALGLVLRANQGDDDEVDQMGANGLSVDGQQVSATDAEFAPPWPARRVGGNCSAGGVVAHWQVDPDGSWQCTVTTPDAVTPPPPPPPPPDPAPVQAPPPPYAPPPPPPVEPPPAYDPPPPAYEPPPPAYEPPPPEPQPAPAPPPPQPPPPPQIQLPFPLPPILLPPAAAVLP
ncbi:hypothetical protein ACFO5K_27450 [Nocardia halotolerans]|uniref:Uncharacterized protein n=1 Tax=Nocardia halotolerans TaxID=1755878 RepID=A0ABV8VP30_9NOCA